MSPPCRPAAALALLLAWGAAGCAAAPPPEAPARAAPRTLETLAPRPFAGPLSPELPLAVEVRMASEADLRDATWTSEAEALGLVVGLTIGIGATGGLLAAPILAVYAVFGATYPVSAFSVEGWKRASVREALGDVDLPARTLAALRRSWPAAEPGAGARLDVLIPAYGFVAGEPDEACFFLSARYVLTRPGAPPHEDWIVLEPLRRSADAPPAFCAQVRRFSEEGGALVRHTAEEAAEIVAAILARRLLPASAAPPASGLVREVGRLRRLALLPIRLDFSPRDPGWCMDGCDPGALRAGLAADARRELGARRGYELVEADAAEGVAADAEALARFAGESPDAALPAALAARVRELAAAARAEGVVVVHGRATALTWLDGAAWLATFSLAIPVSMARIGTRLEADVFEAATGRRVWTGRASVAGSPGGEGSPLARRLFDPIEPALPAVLSTPPAAPR